MLQIKTRQNQGAPEHCLLSLWEGGRSVSVLLETLSHRVGLHPWMLSFNKLLGLGVLTRTVGVK